MTTIRQIIIDAYRESGLVQLGLTPDSDEFDEGLRKLQNIIDSLYGYEMGDPLIDLSYGRPPTANSYAAYEDLSSYIDSTYIPQNVRLVVNADQPETFYLPPQPDDGARFSIIDAGDNFSTNNITVNGNGRKIDSPTLTADGAARTWMYRADLATWKVVSDITQNSENPFPRIYDDFLMILLAMRMNPRYQTQAAPETLKFYGELKRKFRAQYRQKHEMAVEEALRRLNPQFTIDNLYSVDHTNARFNRGHIV